MRHNGHVVGRSVRGNAQQFLSAADPHHIGLQDIDEAFVDQPAEAVAGIFMLAGRPFQRGVRLLDFAIASTSSGDSTSSHQ